MGLAKLQSPYHVPRDGGLDDRTRGSPSSLNFIFWLQVADHVCRLSIHSRSGSDMGGLESKLICRVSLWGIYDGGAKMRGDWPGDAVVNWLQIARQSKG